MNFFKNNIISSPVNKQYKAIHIGFCLMALFSLGILPGCTDDIDLSEKSDPNAIEIEGDCIGFKIKLDKDITSRSRADEYSKDEFSTAIESYENYIDTQDKFRVFFFTKNGEFLFGANDRIVGSLTSKDLSADYWYVRIPMTMLVDRENQEYDVDKIKAYLKNHSFKIAVLANWPNAGDKINPADWDDSENGYSTSDNPSSTLKGNPHWNWSNSILNKDANPADIRNINDLHHLYNDSYYAERSSVYGDFMENNVDGEAGLYAGEPTDWVQMRNVKDGWKGNFPLIDEEGKDVPTVDRSTEVADFDSKTTANQWIRANCTPEVERNRHKMLYRHYQHLWFLWNFDASYKYGLWENNENLRESAYYGFNESYEDNFEWKDNTPAKITNPWGAEWYQRNGKRLYNWMENSYNDGDNPKAIGSIRIDFGESNSDVFFQYDPASGSSYAYCRKVGDYYGIQLPAIGSGTKISTAGTIQFQARTSGTLRIKWSSQNGTSSGLGVQVGSSYKEHTGMTATVPTDWKADQDGLEYWDVSIEADSQPVYIFCTNGRAVVYSIEFIRGKYLYETDREGIMPSPDRGIPMYGVKEFPAIPDWQKGTTFNLVENISLIRALAKVEVYIAKKFGLPRHVYFKSMNRAARCEPMDVETDTDQLWVDDHLEKGESGTYLCEWFAIQKHGPSYNHGNYKEWLKWFYGSWTTAKWKTEGYVWNYDLGIYEPKEENGLKGWQKAGDIESSDSPHIFNPYIYRTDFCRFLYADAGEDNPDYYKYVLYVPEKNLDDPATAGLTTSAPKVPHIEYRFAPPSYEEYDINEYDIAPIAENTYTNTENNLDDNDSFRIYFTNYGTMDKNVVPVNEELENRNWISSTYDTYVRDVERLKPHWPIMRNHCYKFFVGGSGPENPEIRVQVSDWGHRKVIVEW